jgi:hypothetical protein
LGLPLFVAGSTMYGLDGAISALCATELSILILQIFYVIWGRRQFLNYSIETK